MSTTMNNCPKPLGGRRRSLSAAVRWFLLPVLLAGFAGCAATGDGGGGSGSESASDGPSRCGVCGGSGQTKDHNRGVMEVCHYCNGRGVY